MAGGGGKNSGLLKMEIEWDAKGKGGKSAKPRIESRMIQQSAERKLETQSATVTVWAEIYSFLHLISKNMKLKAESRAEIQTIVAQ
jgi:hypothetical protein